MAIKKNIIPHYKLPRAGKERGSTKSATVVGAKLDYPDYYSLPVFPAFVDHGLYTSGNWYEHISYRLVAFEIPLDGNMRFQQRDMTTIANPGTVYLMHRGENSRLESGPSGRCRKLALCVGGASISSIMADTGLANHVAINVTNLKKLVDLIQSIEYAIRSNEIHHACGLTYEFLLELASNLQHELPEKMTAIIESMKIGIPQKLALDDFISEFHVSRSTLHRLFKRFLNTTPKEYYRKLKLEFARSLLNDSHYPVKTIAERSGFSSPVQFTHAFRRTYQMSPLAYREKRKKEDSFS